QPASLLRTQRPAAARRTAERADRQGPDRPPALLRRPPAASPAPLNERPRFGFAEASGISGSEFQEPTTSASMRGRRASRGDVAWIHLLTGSGALAPAHRNGWRLPQASIRTLECSSGSSWCTVGFVRSGAAS